MRATIKTFVCCGEDVRKVHWDIDAAPLCRTCGRVMTDVQLGRRVDGIIPDDIPGGLVMEHVEPGRKVYSRTELNQVLAKHGWRVSDYGKVSPNDVEYTKQGGTFADLRTKEQRISEMAAFLGLTVEQYYSTFSRWLDT